MISLAPVIRTALLLLACPVAVIPARSADRLLIANATIVTLVEGQEEPFTGYILVDSVGRISRIGKGAPPPALGAVTVFDADGQVAMPGFLSGHSHLRGSVSRGLAADQWVTEWGRVTQWLLAGNKTEPNDLYYYTLHGALDMLRGGVTTVYNYTTGGSVEANAEQLEAEFDAGGHFVFGYSPPARDTALTMDEMRAQVRSYLDHANGHPKRDLLLRHSFGSIAMRWTEEETRREFELLKEFPEFEMDIQLHYLEPPPTVPRTHYERSNFQWLKKYGILGPNLG